MLWFKHPALYPRAIAAAGQRFFFTEPDWITVPDQADLADVRRDAIDGKIRIGVSTGSRFFPSLGKIWPRVRVGNVRTGVKQAQFRQLLAAQGFNWGTMEADHVRDLQWAGEDDYANLWPLERVHNLQANRILRQYVTYRTAQGTVLTVQICDTPLGLYFVITGYGNPNTPVGPPCGGP